MRGCPNCGRMIDDNLKRCPFCDYDLSDLNNLFRHYKSESDIKIPKYAGFIKRMAANGIDILLAMILILPFYLFFGFSFNVCVFIYFVVYFFYIVFMQCSKLSGTLGEAFVGVYVVDDLNCPITFGLSFKRNFLRILNVLPLGIGVLFIIFSKNKQSLSDMISNTFVVNRVTDENFNEFSYSHLFKRFLAFVLDLFVLTCFYVLYLYLCDVVCSFNVLYVNYLLDFAFVLFLVFYFPYLESRSGYSFGKWLFRLKVVKIDGERIGFFRALFRFFAFAFELLIFPFGTLLCFVMPRKQSFKDLLSKTIVIDRY